MSINFASKFIKYPTALGRMVIVIINNVYCIPTYVVWMTMLIPLKHLHPDAYYKIEGLFFHWLLAVVSMWSYSAGYDIVESGDDINECRNKRTLVLANHQSTADVPLLMANFNAKENILPNIMWIMDRLFKYTNFGIVSIIHQDFFIASGKNKRDESINALKCHIKSSFIKRKRNWMVLFPEGGFLRKRRAVSQSFARKNNLPVLQHVTLPRVGALHAIVDSMCVESSTHSNTGCESGQVNNNSPDPVPNGDFFERKISAEKLQTAAAANATTSNATLSSSASTSTSTPTLAALTSTTGKADTLAETVRKSRSNINCLLDYVLDITIAYPDGKPIDLPNILHGMRGSCKTHMLYRLYKVSEIPIESNALSQWLYDRFTEKNDLLENFYKFGTFYTDRKMNSSVIQQDLLRFLLINIFFITSTYFHYQMFCTLFTYCTCLAYGTTT